MNERTPVIQQKIDDNLQIQAEQTGASKTKKNIVTNKKHDQKNKQVQLLKISQCKHSLARNEYKVKTYFFSFYNMIE